MERKKTSLMILGVCAFILSVIGVTYAFWQLRLSQTDNNTISSSCFEVTLMNEGDAIHLDKAYPISDGEAEDLEPYTFTIKNKCNANASYQINLESLTKMNNGSVVENRLDEQYLKVKLNEVGQEGSIQELTESNRVNATLIDGQTEGEARADKGYKLETGYLGPNAEKNYELRIWLKGSLTTADEDAMNKTFASKITVTTTYLSETQMKPQIDLELALCENNIIAQGKATPFEDRNIQTYEFKLDDAEDWDTSESLTKSYTVEQGSHTISLKVTDNTGAVSEIKKTIEAKNYEEPTTAELGGKTLTLATEGNGLYKVGHCDVTGTVDDKGFSHEEYRYAGANYKDDNTDYVHNYVNIDNQVWRIIGLVNTPEGQRVKLVKDEPIGEYIWDTSAEDVNYGEGVNEWSESDLMRLLNPTYELNKGQICTYDSIIHQTTCNQEESFVNNSLYWNGEDGQCYNGSSNKVTSCSFDDNNKMPESLKEMIEEITWNTGSNGREYSYNNIKINECYYLERSSNTGDICKEDNGGEGGNNCNDSVERKTSWQGKVGLIYPSDYGYATSGGTETTRASCFETVLNSWKSYNECYNNDWLFSASNYWTLSPQADSYTPYYVFYVHNSGVVSISYTSIAGGVRPSVYLKENVHIKDDSNDGSYSHPYELELVE